MTPPEDILNDVKAFIPLWKEIAKKIKEDSNHLMKEYGVTDEEYGYDDGTYFFTINNIRYKFDWCEEVLYNLEEEIYTGPAYDYLIKNNASIKNAYNIIETEMINRGWYYDQEDYEYYISKNGWSTTMPYFCESIEDVGEFEYDPEMLE